MIETSSPWQWNAFPAKGDIATAPGIKSANQKIENTVDRLQKVDLVAGLARLMRLYRCARTNHLSFDRQEDAADLGICDYGHGLGESPYL